MSQTFMMDATLNRDRDTASGVTDAPHLPPATRNVRGHGRASTRQRVLCEVRMGSLNVGTMEGKALEVLEMMKREWRDCRGGSLPYGWWSANRWYVSSASMDPRRVGRRQRRRLSEKRWIGWPAWAMVRRCCALRAISLHTSVRLSHRTKKA